MKSVFYLSMIMKHLFWSFVCCLMCYSTTLAGNVYATEKKDTVAFMRATAEQCNKHKGEKVAFIVDLFRKNNMPIKFMGVCPTSPWIDKEGKSYVESINISCYEGLETYNKYGSVPIINIMFTKPYIDTTTFESLYHSEYLTEEENMDKLKDLFSFSSVEFLFIPKHYGEEK